MATQIEVRNHGNGKKDVAIGDTKLPIDTEPDILIALRTAYRAGRADEAAIRAAALSGLINGSPLA